MKIFALIMMIIEFGINPETARVYPMTAQVVGYDYEMNLVTLVDVGSEECFQFYGIDNGKIGDISSLMMVDPGTPEIYGDDIILFHWYTGITMEIPESMQNMTIPYPDEYPILTCGD